MSFVFLTLLMLPVLGTATDTPTPRRSFLVQRDVVAMHIMSGMAVNNVGRGTNAFDQRLAKRAYQMADALIREGNRQ